MLTDYDAARVAQMQQWLAAHDSGSPVMVPTRNDIAALLTALTAAEAERDQWQQDREDVLGQLTRGWSAEVQRTQDRVADLERQLATAEARATRLAALEEAARTVRESDPLLRGIEQPELRRHLFALYATVDALDAPPGEATDA